MLATTLSDSPNQFLQRRIHEVKLGRYTRTDPDPPDHFALGTSPRAEFHDYSYASPEQVLSMPKHLGFKSESEVVVYEADAKSFEPFVWTKPYCSC